MKQPVDIGSMPLAGPSKDGKVVFFDFDGNDGSKHRFKVSYEAVPSIVELLIKSAEMAAQLRGDSALASGQKVSATAFKASSFVVALTPDMERVAILFEAAGRQRVGVELSPSQCTEFLAVVQRELARISFPPTDSNAN